MEDASVLEILFRVKSIALSRLLSPRGVLTFFALVGACASAQAQTSEPTLVVDDFERGVVAWTRNDKNRVGLSDIVATAPDNSQLRASKGAVLLTFKTANQSWASLSRPVDGAAWAKIGANRLTFWINGNGGAPGVDLQLRGKAGGRDIVYKLPLPVRLTETKWRRVAISLSDFKGPNKETLGPRLSGVYLLQFIQTGTWESRFFALDDISVVGTGAPASAAPATPTPTQSATPLGGNAQVSEDAVAVNADFKKVTGKVRALANVSLAPTYAINDPTPFESSAPYRSSLAVLKPRFIRIDVAGFSSLTDSLRPSFDFGRLIAATRRIRALGAQPLICITNPPEWALDARGYAALAAGAAKALNAKGGPRATTFELCAWSGDLSDTTSVGLYNAGYGALKGVSKTFVVGGYGAPAGSQAAQGALLKNARGLDFLSVSFFGTSQGAPRDEVLIDAARTVFPLKTAAGLLDKSRFSKAALWVTQAGVSAARDAGDYVPSDIRLVQPLAGAWWAQFLMSGSRLADQTFHSDATNPEWGLLDNTARAYRAYYAMYLWNAYFPTGSTRVSATSGNVAIATAAVNTPTAHNLMLVNTTGSEQTAQISIRGFPVLRQVRVRRIGEQEATKLPTVPIQTVKMAPFEVAVVQFIEPPKK